MIFNLGNKKRQLITGILVITVLFLATLASPAIPTSEAQANTVPTVDVPALPKIQEDIALQSGLSLAFGILGGVCLLVIIIQGMRFALSGGNPDKTTQARQGIIYALIGLAIALAGSSVTNFALDFFNPDPDLQLTGAGGLFAKMAAILAAIIGMISVIIIIIAGIRYSLSRGSSDATSGARNAIIYALVGLAVAIVAGPIISLVIGLLT